MGGCDIDIERLISLVESRPALWDKTQEIYKDRNKTRTAWADICVLLRPDYERLEDEDKNAFGKEVMKRWTNVRDAFVKSAKKLSESRKSGLSTGKVKKYIYNNQLSFLNKTITDEWGTADVVPKVEPINIEVPSILEENVSKEYAGTSQTVKLKKTTRTQKRRKLDELEIRMLEILNDSKPDRHMQFFKGVVPSLEHFDDDEILQFQMGVLQVVTDIKKRKVAMLPAPCQLLNYSNGRQPTAAPNVEHEVRIKNEEQPAWYDNQELLLQNFKRSPSNSMSSSSANSDFNSQCV